MPASVDNVDFPPEETGVFSIGSMSAEFEISTRAIRFYEAKGLLRPTRKNGERRYSQRDHARLALILRGKRLGFTLSEIAEYLTIYDAAPTDLNEAERLLSKVHESIKELEQKQADITYTLRELRSIRTQCIQTVRHGHENPNQNYEEPKNGGVG